MTLEALCAPFPGLLDLLTSEDIATVELLVGVLQDPAVARSVGIKAGPLASLRQSLGLIGGPPVPSFNPPAPLRVESVEPETMPLADLLGRVIARGPSDEHGLRCAQARVRCLAVSPVGKRSLTSICIEATVAMCNELASVPVGLWPPVYRQFDVVTWDFVLNTARPIFCPLTGEPVIDGYTSQSGLNWSGLIEDQFGLVGYLASLADFRRQHTDQAILDGVAEGFGVNPPRPWVVAINGWRALTESRRLAFGEQVYAPRTSNVAVSRSTRSLEDVLASMFSSDELRRLVNSCVGEIRNDLSTGGSLSNLTFEIVSMCNQRGITRKLIAAVMQERPRRASELQPYL